MLEGQLGVCALRNKTAFLKEKNVKDLLAGGSDRVGLDARALEFLPSGFSVSTRGRTCCKPPTSSHLATHPRSECPTAGKFYKAGQFHCLRETTPSWSPEKAGMKLKV